MNKKVHVNGNLNTIYIYIYVCVCNDYHKQGDSKPECAWVFYISTHNFYISFNGIRFITADENRFYYVSCSIDSHNIVLILSFVYMQYDIISMHLPFLSVRGRCTDFFEVAYVYAGA